MNTLDETSTFRQDKAPHAPWAFTYKYLSTCNRVVDIYDICRERLSKYGFIKHIVEELDSKGKLHIHGIVMLRKGFFRQKLIVHGFHLHLAEVYDEKDWIKYMDKQQPQNEVPYLFDPIYEIN